MKDFNQYQFDDLLIRESDIYTQTKDEMILDYLKDRGPLKILEVGCGSGALSFSLAEKGHAVLGIDLAPEYIELAERRAGRIKNGECSFQVVSIEDFSSNDQFDVVISMDALEHIRDDEIAVKKLTSLVRPGGSLVLTVPAMPTLFGFHDEALGHYRRYSKGRLRDLICQSGLIKIDKIRYFGFTLIPACILYSKLLRRPYPKTSLGSAEQKTFLGVITKIVLTIDRLLPFPAGISLILYGHRPK